MKDVKTIFFDMDGTLIQSEFGIFDSVLYALEQFDYQLEDKSILRKFIGPPLYTSFTEFLGFEPEAAERAVALYRDFYSREGIYRAPLYDGVREMLRDLKDAGLRLACVTSKPDMFAKRVLEFHDIGQFFEILAAPAPQDHNADKAPLLLRAMGELSIDPAEVVMVGDRMYDINGANDAGVRSIGVLYGYGSEEELTEAGATELAWTPAEVVRICLDRQRGDLK
ncbi:MAG: HAD hydrolase-like protein [Lachnospiraceae bacterium]|nr:HAD hydrolase-like protein [Lachnospiraceae bacterium]